jgi:hypothetical protein
MNQICEEISEENFLKSIDLVTTSIQRIALVPTNKFIALNKIYNEYLWLPLNIENLPYIPIKIADVDFHCVSTPKSEQVILVPKYQFSTNGQAVITPKREGFEFTDNKQKTNRYSINLIFNPNYQFLTNNNLEYSLKRGHQIQDNNAVEWNKIGPNILPGTVSKEYYQQYLANYESQLQTFDEIYNTSVENVKTLKKEMKKLHN